MRAWERYTEIMTKIYFLTKHRIFPNWNKLKMIELILGNPHRIYIYEMYAKFIVL